jgi:drug/metabolite transporter (DMT)-like permease
VTTPTLGRDPVTLAAFIGVAVLGGLNAIAAKASVRELDPFWSAGSRFLVAGLILVIFVVASGRALPRGASLRGAVLYGAVALAGSFGFIYPALRDVPAATAIVFIALVPLETFALSIVQGQERFRVQGLVGALVSLAGVLVIVWEQLGAALSLGSIGLLLVGTLFISQGAILLKSIPRADPYATNGIAMLVCGAILLGVSAIAGETWAIPAQPGTLVAMIYIVVAGSIGLFGLYLFAIRRWTASAVSYTTLLMPLVTLPVAAVLLDEPITVPFLFGTAIALLGIYIGAFMTVRPGRSTVTAAAECLPIDDCPAVPSVRRRQDVSAAASH